jgi:hypothetical protein
MDNEIKMVRVKKYNFSFLVGFTKLRKNWKAEVTGASWPHTKEADLHNYLNQQKKQLVQLLKI